MAFSYTNAGPPVRYSYHMPMQLIQQVELSAMHVQSSTDISNLNNISHCSPVGQQMASATVELGSNNISSRAVIGDFPAIHRPAPGFCMPSVAEASFHSNRGNFSQHFQYFSGQPQTSDSCQHGQSINKTSDISGVLCDSSHQFNNIKSSKSSACSSKQQKTKFKQNIKRGEKDKKYKRVRFVKPGCSNGCLRRCQQKLSQKTREDLFNEFWNLSDDSKRREFISRHAIKMPMMTCKEGSRRSFSVDWAFTVRGKSFSVCKLFFLDTLDISEKMAYSVIKESTFFSNDYFATKRKKARIKKPVWFETDVDSYSETKTTRCSKRRPRYESKREKITEIGPGCTDSCRRNCQAKFTHEEKLAIFNGYRNLSNVRKQREFIMKHVRRLERKYVKSDKLTRRGCSVEWLLPVKGESLPVCKTFFLHTVGISEHTAYSIGLQNEIQPLEKQKAHRKVQHWSFRRNKYLKELIAKGRLKSSLKVRRKKCREFDTSSNVNADDETKIRKMGHPHENDRLKLWTLNNSQPFLVMSSNKLTMDAHLQHPEFPQQCLIGAVNVRGSLPSADTQMDLTSPFLHQPNHSSFGNNSNPGCISQQLVHTQNDPLHQQGNQRSADFNVNSGPKANHDSLLLQTLKNTRDDLFHFNQEKDSSFVKMKKSQSPKEEKLRKTDITRETDKKLFTKKLKDGCSDTCRKKCSLKIPQTVRVELFNEFWQLQSDTSRREFILPIVIKVPKKSNKHVDSRRGCTIEWTVPYNGELHIVCKKFFLDTFDITENFVKTVLDKIERNEGSMEDMRGKHGKRSAVFVQEEKEIEKHIKSLATYKAVRCIRCNRDFPRWCLEKKVSLSQLYKEYAEKRKLLGVKPACRTSFTTISAKKFNININAASENTCDECADTS